VAVSRGAESLEFWRKTLEGRQRSPRLAFSIRSSKARRKKAALLFPAGEGDICPDSRISRRGSR